MKMLQQCEKQVQKLEVLIYKLLGAQKIKINVDITQDHHHQHNQKKQY
jgi:hypothetical protein